MTLAGVKVAKNIRSVIILIKMPGNSNKKLICPVCQGKEFETDTIVLPKYGLLRLTDYKADVYICKNCRHMMLFEQGSTFFLGVD